MQHGPRRSYSTRASSKPDLGRYRTLLVASKRTSSDFYAKRTNFSFDKAENTRQCTSTYFSLTLALCSPLQTFKPAIVRLDGTQTTSSLLQTLACHQQTRDRRFSADALASSSLHVAVLASTVRQFSLCSPLEAFTAPQRLLAFTLPSPFPFMLQANLTVQSLVSLMQSSSLKANQALNRIRIDTSADDGMSARDTIGMYVSGRRGSLLPTIDRKRQFHRNLQIITPKLRSDYYCYTTHRNTWCKREEDKRYHEKSTDNLPPTNIHWSSHPSSC